MTSQINPYNIDGTYPIAGQDNNSQGFRTNFTNTSTNFEYAAQEITDLQTNVVLKAALNGTTLNNNMNGSLLFNAQTQQITQTVVSLGTVTTSATLNYGFNQPGQAGPYWTLTTGGSITLQFVGLPGAGVLANWAVAITVASVAHTVTLPPSVTVNANGIQGLDTSTNVMTFAATGTYTLAFSTTDGGTTVTVNEVNKELQPFNNSAESLASAGAANLALTTSYFTTSGTANLVAGVAGQIKTFVQTASVANMVMTVSSAGWKSSGTGTITFPATTYGTGCTLQYINAKWYCIGNNGCSFA
jgi:hypothetical protein